MVYYVGSILLFFVPGNSRTRGGGAWLLKGIYAPSGPHDYYMALAALAWAGAVALLLVLPLARGLLRLIGRCGYRPVSIVALALLVLLVALMTGGMGVAVLLVGTGLGLIPVLYGSRRMNCLGVILLPMACNMSGFGPVVAGWLGLI